MNIAQLYKYIKQDENPTIDDIRRLKDIVEQYPYFQLAIFIYLKAISIHQPNDLEEELSRLSIYINDRKALFYYIMSEEYKDFQTTAILKSSGDRTSLLLDAFFDSHQDLELDNSINLEQSIVNNSSAAISDYFTYMNQLGSIDPLGIQTSNAPLLKNHEIIDSFIQKYDAGENFKIQIDLSESDAPMLPMDDSIDNEEEAIDDSFFTETLARIYTKQKKYDKAYKIIKHLSLNNPKKNAYFADQLSFLEKLIINSKYKNTK